MKVQAALLHLFSGGAAEAGDGGADADRGLHGGDGGEGANRAIVLDMAPVTEAYPGESADPGGRRHQLKDLQRSASAAKMFEFVAPKPTESVALTDAPITALASSRLARHWDTRPAQLTTGRARRDPGRWCGRKRWQGERRRSRRQRPSGYLEDRGVAPAPVLSASSARPMDGATMVDGVGIETNCRKRWTG